MSYSNIFHWPDLGHMVHLQERMGNVFYLFLFFYYFIILGGGVRVGCLKYRRITALNKSKVLRRKRNMNAGISDTFVLLGCMLMTCISLKVPTEWYSSFQHEQVDKR